MSYTEAFYKPNSDLTACGIIDLLRAVIFFEILLTSVYNGDILCISDIYSMRGDNLKINISLTSDKTMYEQIEESIRQAVLNGELENNHPMPSVRQLAAEINVSTITVKRAYADLEREGILYTVAGRGTYIRLDNKDKIQSERIKQLMEKLDGCISELLQSGVPKSEIIEHLNKSDEGRT